jgi:YidC/Oxa1 family membrane protein insertase
VLNLTWQNTAVQQQKDLEYERGQSKVGYRYDGDFDDHMASGGGSKEFKGKVDWVAVNNSSLIQHWLPKTALAAAMLSGKPLPTAARLWCRLLPTCRHLSRMQPAATVPLGLYFGPNDYQTLKQYNNDMEDMVDLGSGIFSFVKYINRWIVIPAFNFFSGFTQNYGIVILLLTLLLRLMISPLTYSSYLSGAKMKVLRPEIEQVARQTRRRPAGHEHGSNEVVPRSRC